MIFEPRKIKSGTVSTVSPSVCLEVMGNQPWIFIGRTDAEDDAPIL